MPKKSDWTPNQAPSKRFVTSIALDDGSAKGTTISCFGDRGFARVLSKLSDTMASPVGALVTEALEAYKKASLSRIRANYPHQTLKEHVIMWARLEGLPVGILVRQALDDAYGPVLAEIEIDFEKAEKVEAAKAAAHA